METRLSTGTLIDGTFEIIEVLGSGSMATVYLAKHLTMHQMVAVKVLNDLKASEKDAVKRFQSEAIAIAKLDHEHIVNILKTGTSNDRPYICMEYLDGQTLEQTINEGAIEPAEVKRIGIEICDALSHAHESGVIHRDVKPSNILFDTNKASKLTDFGIAKFIHQGNQGLTATGEILGTPAYMSPEQLLNKAVDARADIYSLACVLYQGLAGEPPFAGETAYQVAQSHLSALPKPIQGVGDLNKVILKALSKSPDERYQTAMDLKNALQAARLEEHRSAQNKNRSLSKPLIAIGSTLLILSILALFASLPRKNDSKVNTNTNPLSAASSSALTLKDFQVLVEKLKNPKNDAEKARQLKDAYSFIESNSEKKISRSTRLNIMHDYATLLANFHISEPALEIFQKILRDVELNGMPKAQGENEDKFAHSNLLNCQSKAIEILYRHREIAKARAMYESMQLKAADDNPALLRAAILLQDKSTIAKVARNKPGSETSAVKLAHIFLEHDLQDELGMLLVNSFSVNMPAESYTESQADLMIVQAKYDLLKRMPDKAAQLINKFSTAKTPEIPEAKRLALLQRCAEILSVAGKLEEARKLLVSMHLEDGPVERAKIDSLSKPSAKGAELTLVALLDEHKFGYARELADYILSSADYPIKTKARCAMRRSKACQNPGVFAYYVCVARDFAKDLPKSKDNIGLKIATEYSYAGSIKYFDMLGLAEPIFSRLASGNDLSKAAYEDKSFIELSISNELQILNRSGKKEQAKELLKSYLPQLTSPSDIHVFVEMFLESQNDEAVKKLIDHCRHYHDLVWSGEKCLDHNRPDLALLCLNKIDHITEDRQRNQQMQNCCRTILGALCALYSGDKTTAKRYFDQNKDETEGLEEFTKTYAVLKALSS